MAASPMNWCSRLLKMTFSKALHKRSFVQRFRCGHLQEALLRRWRNVTPMWPGNSRKPFSVQTARNGEFQERWTVASGRNRVSGESGRAMNP